MKRRASWPSVVHVAIIFARDAAGWDNYLTLCFQEISNGIRAEGLVQETSDESQNEADSENSPPGILIAHQAVEELPIPLPIDTVTELKQSKAQIVILSPDFLEFVVSHPSFRIGRLFDPSRVIALLCGVDESDITSVHRTALISYKSWTRMKVPERDPQFVVNLLQKTVEVMQRGDQPQGNGHHNGDVDSPLLSHNNNLSFKLHPRKVREGLAKILILLQHPLEESSSSLSVTIEGSDGRPVSVAHHKPNPYTVKFTVPDHFFSCSQYLNVSLIHNGHSLGCRPIKCESRLGEMNELLQVLPHPLAFMCQTLGVPLNSPSHLDEILANRVRHNVPRQGVRLLCAGSNSHSDTLNIRIHKKGTEECPTLLHLAAKFGLQQLCSVLIQLPDASVAIGLPNNKGLTPADMATKEGFHLLAQSLDEFCVLSRTAPDIYVTEDRDSAVYEHIGSTCSTRRNSTDDLLPEFTEERNGAISCESLPPTLSEDTGSSGSVLLRRNPTASPPPPSSPWLSLSSICNKTSSILSATDRRYLCNTDSQLELIQILEDFKKGKYTLTEVESLCRTWQNKQNEANLREKDEQMEELRRQYVETQKKMPGSSRKATALEKLRSLWTLNRKEQNHHRSSSESSVATKHMENGARSHSSEVLDLQSPVENGPRPVSSWSNSSGSSRASNGSSSDASGRLSVLSTTDSGMGDMGEPRNEENVSKPRKPCLTKALTVPPPIPMIINRQYLQCTVEDADPLAPLLLSLSSNHSLAAAPKLPSSASDNFLSLCPATQPRADCDAAKTATSSATTSGSLPRSWRSSTITTTASTPSSTAVSTTQYSQTLLAQRKSIVSHIPTTLRYDYPPTRKAGQKLGVLDNHPGYDILPPTSSRPCLSGFSALKTVNSSGQRIKDSKSSSPEIPEYTVMKTRTDSRSNSESSLAPVIDEPNYYNVPGIQNDYVEMKPPIGKPPIPAPSSTPTYANQQLVNHLRARKMSLPTYVNLGRIHEETENIKKSSIPVPARVSSNKSLPLPPCIEETKLPSTEDDEALPDFPPPPIPLNGTPPSPSPPPIPPPPKSIPLPLPVSKVSFTDCGDDGQASTSDSAPETPDYHTPIIPPLPVPKKMSPIPVAKVGS